jgi:PAS domain S-box-containing protein
MPKAQPRRISRGPTSVSTDPVGAAPPPEAPPPHLTPRQVEVMRLLSRGHTNRQIADALGVSERAVKAHVSLLLEKFGVPNRAGLIARVLSAHNGGTGPAEQYDRYADASFMVQVLHGPEHRFAYLNRKFEEVTGLSSAKIMGRSLREVFPQLRTDFLESLDRAYRTAQPSHDENVPGKWRADDGSERQRVFDLIYHPLRDATGSVIGLLLISIAANGA